MTGDPSDAPEVPVATGGPSVDVANAVDAVGAVGAVDVVAALAARIRDVPDFPTHGILFKDITPLLSDPATFELAIGAMAEPFRAASIGVVAGIEARGFILGAPVAYSLGVGFVPVRKKGKLPGDVVEASYDLEYGSATIEVTADAFTTGQRVLIVDDVLATGGTAAAAVDLVRRSGAEVAGVVFLLEIGFLSGREALAAADAPTPVAVLLG